MRIVSGRYGGRKLLVPTGTDIRPTTDKVRGAVFNMLQARDAVLEAHVLDGFCGSGALGLEALSRGAAHCTFIDKSRNSLQLSKDNAQNFDAIAQSSFLLHDLDKKIPDNACHAPYDLIFLDPPYCLGLVDKALHQLIRGQCIAKKGWVVCETERKAILKIPDGFIMGHEKTYGDIKISLLHQSS